MGKNRNQSNEFIITFMDQLNSDAMNNAKPHIVTNKGIYESQCWKTASFSKRISIAGELSTSEMAIQSFQFYFCENISV